MHGCGLRIGEALAVNVRCRIAGGTILRVSEQVDQHAHLRPLKFRKKGDYRDIPLPQYVSDAIDKHIADHGITSDGYLYQGRKYKFVVRRSYQEDFTRAAAKAGLPEFVHAGGLIFDALELPSVGDRHGPPSLLAVMAPNALDFAFGCAAETPENHGCG
jgi:integrase